MSKKETTELMEVTQETTAITTTDDGLYELNFESAQRSYCSFEPKTTAEKIAFFNAVNSPEDRLKKMVNMVIEVKHIYAETIDFVNKETGEATPGVRIVLIDKDGKGYQASSKGVFSSVAKLLKIMGHPATWEKPVKIKPREITKSDSQNVLVFDLVG